MSNQYATCPLCVQPTLSLSAWPDYGMIICTCENKSCKLSQFTLTPDVYTDADQLSAYDLRLQDVHQPTVERLSSRIHAMHILMFNSAG